MKISSLIALTAAILMTGCASKVTTYDSSGRMIGSCQAEKFGVGYRSSVLGIEEQFVGWGYCEGVELHNTEEQARLAAEQTWRERYDNQVKRIEDILTTYKALPWYTRAFSFVFKRGWKVNLIVKQKMQEFEDELNESLLKVANMKVERLSRGNYTLNAPMLEVGQQVFVSVSHNNYLDMGVHAFTVRNISYALDFGGGDVIRYRADVVGDGKELRLETYNDRLSTGWTYHEVHLNKQEAVDRIKGVLEKQANKVQEQLKKMEQEND